MADSVNPPQGYISVNNTFATNPAEGFFNVDFHLKIRNLDSLAGTFWANTFTFHNSTAQLPKNHVGGDQGGYLGLQVIDPGSYLAIFSIFWATDAPANLLGPGAQVVRAIEMWYDDAHPFDPPITDPAHTDPNRKVAGGPYLSIRAPVALRSDTKYRLRIWALANPGKTGWSAYLMDEDAQKEVTIGNLEVPPTWGDIGQNPGGFMERFKDMPNGCVSIPASTTIYYPATANGGSILSSLSTNVYGACQAEVQPRCLAVKSGDGRVTVTIGPHRSED